MDLETQGTTTTTESGESFRESVSTQASPREGFFSSLPEDLRSEPSLQNVKSAEDLAQQFINAQKLIGKKNSEPAEGSDEDYKKFYKGIGMPEDVSGYEFQEVEGLADTGFDVEGFKQIAHEAGLTKRQAETAFNKMSEQLMGNLKIQNEQKTQRDQEFLKMAHDSFGGEEAWSKASAQAQQVLIDTVPQEIRANIKDMDNKSILSMVYAINKAQEAFTKEDQPLSTKNSAGGNSLDSPLDIKDKMKEIYNNENFRRDPRLQEQYRSLTKKLMKAEQG